MCLVRRTVSIRGHKFNSQTCCGQLEFNKWPPQTLYIYRRPYNHIIILGEKRGTSVYHGVLIGFGVRHWNASVSTESRRIHWVTGQWSGKIRGTLPNANRRQIRRGVWTLLVVGKSVRLKLTRLSRRYPSGLCKTLTSTAGRWWYADRPVVVLVMVVWCVSADETTFTTDGRADGRTDGRTNERWTVRLQLLRQTVGNRNGRARTLDTVTLRIRAGNVVDKWLPLLLLLLLFLDFDKNEILFSPYNNRIHNKY